MAGARPRKREDWISHLDALRAGDRMALVRVTKLITGFLTRYRAYQARDSWDDLVQEVLMALIDSAERGTLREPEAFVSFTGTIVRNKLMDWTKRASRPGAADELGEPEIADAIRDPVQREQRASPDLLMDLERALESLPKQHQRIVHAIYLEGRSYQEASEGLEIPLGSLKRLQTEGLKQLRARMKLEKRE